MGEDRGRKYFEMLVGILLESDTPREQLSCFVIDSQELTELF